MSLNKKLFTAIFLAQLLLSPVSALAQQPLAQGQQDSYGLETTARGARLPRPAGGVPAAVGQVINGLLSLIGIAFFVLMLWGGFIWMKARGNEAEVERAKNMITNAIIGIIVIGGAYVITRFVLTQVVP